MWPEDDMEHLCLSCGVLGFHKYKLPPPIYMLPTESHPLPWILPLPPTGSHYVTLVGLELTVDHADSTS